MHSEGIAIKDFNVTEKKTKKIKIKNVKIHDLIQKGDPDIIRTILIELLNNSYEDWLNYRMLNKYYNKICSEMLGLPDDQGFINQLDNKIWYDQWIKINSKNKYIKFDPNKSYYPKFIEEWKKVGCNPYINRTKDCLDRNDERGHLGNVKYLIGL